MYCEKKSFSTKEEAVLRIAEIRKEEGDNRKPVRSYKCEKCGMFHLTSWTRKRKKAFANKKIADSINRIEREAEYYKKKYGWE